jgi:hypothetical protein
MYFWIRENADGVREEICRHYYTVKKVSDFPVPIRDVTNKTLPGGE